MKKLLYIDACIRGKCSRTRVLAGAYLNSRAKDYTQIETLYLDENMPLALTAERLLEREKFIAENDFKNCMFEYAQQLKTADTLLIAAPYWDLSFPAAVKLFCENICVRNLTFGYTAEGSVKNLTALKKVVFITTAGGYIAKQHLGFEYIKSLFGTLFAVADFEYFSAEGLDIQGNDEQAILQESLNKIRNI